MARVVVEALGLPAEAVATPPSGAPELWTVTPSTRPPAVLPTGSPTATVGALPPAGEQGSDDDTRWVLWVGIIVAVGMVATVFRYLRWMLRRERPS
jgi:hypothetical protein